VLDRDVTVWLVVLFIHLLRGAGMSCSSPAEARLLEVSTAPFTWPCRATASMPTFDISCDTDEKDEALDTAVEDA
jgi:hypothetical protein